MVSLKNFLVVFDALFLVCLFTCDLRAKPSQKIEQASGAAHEMFNVSDFILKSKNGEKYKIFIARQKNVARYDRVVFMVNANAQVAMLLNSYAKIYANGAKQNAKAVPKLSKTVLIVGIGYDSPLAYDTKRRTRDLTPAASGEEYANGGGAAEFYDFVKDNYFRSWIKNTLRQKAIKFTSDILLAGYSGFMLCCATMGFSTSFLSPRLHCGGVNHS